MQDFRTRNHGVHPENSLSHRGNPESFTYPRCSFDIGVPPEPKMPQTPPTHYGGTRDEKKAWAEQYADYTKAINNFPYDSEDWSAHYLDAQLMDSFSQRVWRRSVLLGNTTRSNDDRWSQRILKLSVQRVWHLHRQNILGHDRWCISAG